MFLIKTKATFVNTHYKLEVCHENAFSRADRHEEQGIYAQRVAHLLFSLFTPFMIPWSNIHRHVQEPYKPV